jgi:predicted component of type VI protein secretion system
MNKVKNFLPALALCLLLAACGGNETRSVDQDNTSERSVDNTVGANATADTTNAMTNGDSTAP